MSKSYQEFLPEPKPPLQIWGNRYCVGDRVRTVLCDLRFLQARCAEVLDEESRDDLAGILEDVQAVDAELRGRNEVR